MPVQPLAIPAPAPPPERPQSFLYLEVGRADKARWVRAAQARRMGLAAWATAALNDAAGPAAGPVAK